MLLTLSNFRVPGRLLVWLGLAILVGLWAPGSGAQQSAPSNYEFVSDLPYPNDGTDDARERCKLDLYLPKDRENFPVLVWFHGGALRTGGK